MKIYGNLEVAALENVTADPPATATSIGRVVWNSTLNTARIQINATQWADLGSGGGLTPLAIDHTYATALEDGIEYIVDLSSGSASLNLPIGPANERYKVVFNIRLIDKGVTSLTVNTQSGQQIYWNGTAKTAFLIDEEVRVEFAWDGTQWTAKSAWYPTYTNLPEATSAALGVVKKNKYQKKGISADITTSTTDIAELKFNNLVVGKTYKVFFQSYINVLAGSGTDYVLTFIRHNGSNIAGSGFYTNGTKPQLSTTQNTEVVFVATTTTVEFGATIVGDASIVDANSYTYSTIEELENVEITTDFT